MAHEHAHRGGRREQQVDPEALAELPRDVGRREVGHALAREHGGPHGERPVNDERVPDDPADVGRGPVDVAVADLVEGFREIGHAHHVAAGRVDDALRFPRRAGCVEDEERVLGVHRLGCAVNVARVLDVVEIVLALALESEGRVAGPRAPAVDDDVLDERQVADGLVDRGLERDLLAAAEREVRADDDLRGAILDARLQGLRAHAREDDGVDGADARAGEHRDDAFGRERHVDDDAVALLDAEALQRVREAVHLAVEAAVRVRLFFAVLPDPQERGLVALVSVDVPVDAVDRGVELSAQEPFVLRRVEAADFLPGLDPLDCLRLVGPEVVGVVEGMRALDGVVANRRVARHPDGRRDDVLVLRKLLDGRLLRLGKVEIGLRRRRRFRTHVSSLPKGGWDSIGLSPERPFNEVTAS